jgi:hypothetical protein
MGAPRKNPPANAIEQIERLAAEGRSIVGIAKHLGVGKHAFKHWCEEYEAIQEAFEVGREAHRQSLIELVFQAAVTNKGANANAMFLLKAMHGFREQDSAHAKVDVGVAVAVAPVMVVRDHGTDDEWAAKAAAQQRALTIQGMHDARVAPIPVNETLSPPAATDQPYYGPPVWTGQAEPAPAPSSAPASQSSASVLAPPSSFDAPLWRNNG